MSKCDTCYYKRSCNTFDRSRGQACIDYKKGKERNERAR